MRTGASAAKPPFRSMMALTIACVLVITGKLFQLQVVKGDYYRELSSQNHIRSVITQAARGIITDRNGIVLADNYPSFTVSVVGMDFDTTSVELLESLIEIDSLILAERLLAAQSNPFRATVIMDDLNVMEAGRVADNLYRLGGVTVDVHPRRRYPYGRDFCHLIGYVGLADSVGVFQGEITGRTGLERILNQRLVGEHGVVREVVDAHGRVVERFLDQAVAPVPGEDVVLTVDSRIQLTADSLITATGHAGAAVVLNYETGEILALSSMPGYDTNLFVGGISSTDWNGILTDSLKPLLNRSWATNYPPGSTYKTVSACWILESGLADRDYMPDPCYGTYHFAGSDFKCWGTHGRLSIIEALAVSCDTYFYRTSMEGDIDDLAEFSRCFGLGTQTTSFLPGEAAGVMPDRQYLNSIYGQGGWGLGNLMIASIGQGEVLATPLQITLTSALIASDFKTPPLSIVVSEPSAVSPWQQCVSRENLETVREGMLETVEYSRGTLHRTLSQLPVTVWGKSGTAENSSGEDHAWVTGYIMEPIPVAFSVVVENGGHGGEIAGPVARGILMKIIQVNQ